MLSVYIFLLLGGFHLFDKEEWFVMGGTSAVGTVVLSVISIWKGGFWCFADTCWICLWRLIVAFTQTAKIDALESRIEYQEMLRRNQDNI